MNIDWGDTVKVNANAPKYYRPLEIASVCFIDKVDNYEESKFYNVDINSYVYQVEFGDGEIISIPERYLELHE